MEIEKEQEKEEGKGRKDEQERERKIHTERLCRHSSGIQLSDLFAKYGYIQTHSVDLISFPVIS